MAVGESTCLVCGEPLVYFEEAREFECIRCGVRERAHSVCEQGHYVCDACHRTEGVERVMALCAASTLKDPFALANELMRDPAIYPNGPEHHTLVGAALLTAYVNAGGALDLPRALEELRGRSMNVPGGACGLWGTCGAAVSAGMYLSIVTGATPMTDESWGQVHRLTARILSRLADIGGPRCCKRGTFVAFEEAVPLTAELTGIQMDLPKHLTCAFVSRNKECIGRRCPYLPRKR